VALTSGLRKAIEKEIEEKYTSLLQEKNKEISELKNEKRWHLRFGYEKKYNSTYYPILFYSASKTYTEGVDTPVELVDLESLVNQIKFNLQKQIEKFEEEQNKLKETREKLSDGSWANVVRAIKLFFTKQ